jgi:hypothetical protein
MKVTELFRSQWSVFWATTFTFGPREFEEFLLPRLGDPPLNACVLADAVQLARAWHGIETDGRWARLLANRRYLVRSVPANGAFHPKTYFFANDREGALLVGSGNLTLSGLEGGREVFALFHGQTSADLGALRAWRDWMQRRVEQLNDPAVIARWADLLERTAGWLSGSATGSALITNDSESMLAQFVARVGAGVDELVVTAPFYDDGGQALADLVRQLRPQAVTLYVGHRTSAPGTKLQELLRALDVGVRLYAVEPRQYVHAKLVIGIRGDQAWVLSGSANLTRAAFLLVAPQAGANVEAGTLVATDVDRARALLPPPEMTVRELTLADLAQVTYHAPTEGHQPPLRLQSAIPTRDGQVHVSFSGQADVADLCLTDGHDRPPLINTMTTRPFPRDDTRALVWITDSDGTAPLSNKVPLDDPDRLRAQLQRANQDRRDRPQELELRDLATPVGAMLVRLHDVCIFDFEETAAAHHLRTAAGQVEDAEFWKRPAHEDLRQDPRAHYYRGWDQGDTVTPDPLFDLLHQMLDEVPAPLATARLVASGTEDGDDDAASDAPKRRWTPDKHVQVRLFNVLSRWSRALADPRLRWLSPLAPVRNFAAIQDAVVECWHGQYLAKDRLIALTGQLMVAFTGTDTVRGFVSVLDDTERAQALAAASRLRTSPVTAALIYAAVQGTTADIASFLFDWQSFLGRLLDLGFAESTHTASDLVKILTGRDASPRMIAERLHWAATYLDDPHWTRKMARDLGLTSVALPKVPLHSSFPVAVEVRGSSHPLTDVRLLRLALEVMRYRKVDSVVIIVPDGKISVMLPGPVYAILGATEYESVRTVDEDYLRAMAASGAGWGEILRRYRAAAS